MKKIKVKIGWSGDNYSAATEINGIVFTTAKSLQKLKNEFPETFRFHVESSMEDDDVLPDYIKTGQYEFEYELQVSAILKELDGVITRAAISKATNINPAQIGHYIQGKKIPRPATEEKIIAAYRQIGKKILEIV